LDATKTQWGGKDAFMHTLVVGPTGSGKTALLLKPMVYQILKARKLGKPVGLTVIEPKGDFVRDLRMLCEASDQEMTMISPTDPNSAIFNVMAGDKTDIVEATVTVLQTMFGRQDQFFSLMQELFTRKIVELLKTLYDDDVYLRDVLINLQNEDLLRQNVNLLKRRGLEPELTDFFINELLNAKSQEAQKFRSFAIGLRAQLENILSNPYLKPIISKPSSFSLDRHFETGGILGIDTSLAKLGQSGDAFGQFVAMHAQLATYRRPGSEDERVPHYLIIDEYSRYINPDVEKFLSIAREYKVAGVFAIQSLGQLAVASGKLDGRAMKQTIMASTRNKMVFGGLEHDDAKEMASIMGKNTVVDQDKIYDGNPLKKVIPKAQKEIEREVERLPYTFFMDGMPNDYFVHKLLQNRQLQPPGITKGEFLPRSKQELREKFLSDIEIEQAAIKTPLEQWQAKPVAAYNLVGKWKKQAMIQYYTDRQPPPSNDDGVILRYPVLDWVEEPLPQAVRSDGRTIDANGEILGESTDETVSKVLEKADDKKSASTTSVAAPVSAVSAEAMIEDFESFYHQEAPPEREDEVFVYEDYKEEVAEEARHAFAMDQPTEHAATGSPIVDASSNSNHEDTASDDPFAVLYEYQEEEEAVTIATKHQREPLPSANEEEPVNLLDSEPDLPPSESMEKPQQKANQHVIQKPMPVGGDDGWPDPSGASPVQEDEERRDSQFIDLIDDDEMF